MHVAEVFLRAAVGRGLVSSGCVGAVARVRRFRPEKFFYVALPWYDRLEGKAGANCVGLSIDATPLFLRPAALCPQ